MNPESLFISDKSLGKGGFGTVFMGQLGEKQVAAKKLSQSEEEFNNLVREASKLKRLQYGKHIAYIHGIILKERKLYMVMEYSEQGDLRNYLKENKKSVTYEQKILFCRGILLGLLYCHSMNVFHGDTKCSNVILGKNLEPKLADFGLSMTVENIEDYCRKYEGSIHWAAPELFSIKDEVVYEKFIADPYPTDVYSLGATFCEISYDGTTEFIDSDDPAMDIMLGIVSPTPKEAFLEEVVDGCCQFERNERISLDECLSALDNVAEDQLPIPAVDDKWPRIQHDIQASSKLEPPPSFILDRPTENLVVGLSNLSLLEWLCINNCVDAVEYMVKLHNPDQKQIEWLYGISMLCRSPEIVDFLQSRMPNSKFPHLRLSNLINNNPQQFIEMLIKARANGCSYNLLKKAIERHHNTTVQAIINSKSHLKNLAIHDAIEFGNVKALKILANAGADFEWEDYYTGNAPIIAAIDTENIEIVKILLEFGVDIHSKNNSVQSSLVPEIQYKPLYLAALKDNREIVKLLLDFGATIGIRSREWHPLSQSLRQQGNASMMRFIGNSINKKSSLVESNPLCTAIQNKQPDLVQILIDNGASIDRVCFNGYAPLHWAVIVDHEEIVRILVRAGADLDARTSNEAQTFHSALIPDYFSECTPLHIAISKGYLGIAKLLIEAGADFSAKNGLQQTIMDAAKEGIKEVERIIRDYAPVNAISIRRAMKSMSHESIEIMISKQQANAEILSECLCIAARSSKKKLVGYLLKYGVKVNEGYRGRSPLEWAIIGGNIETMKILLNAGADVNVKNGRQETPLFQCVWGSQLNVVQFLIDRGADINVRNMLGYKPIRYAKDREAAEILIEASAAIDVKSDDGIELLIQYISESQVDMMQFLVDKGVNINAKDKDGYAPIHYINDKEIIEIFINTGINTNVKDQSRITHSIQHIEESNTEILQFPVDKEADVNTKDGNVLIHYTNSKETVEIPIKTSTDTNVELQYETRLLAKHVKKSDTEMVQYLIKKGADVNIRDEYGHSSIQYANDKEIMRILINAGADINAKDQYGVISLFQYVKESNTEIVQFLVDKEADVNVRDKDGNAPIHFARDIEMVNILLNAGADLNVKDRHGKELLNILMEEQNKNLSNNQYDKKRKKVYDLLEYLMCISEV